MSYEDILQKRIKEVEAQYEQALKQIAGLQNTIVGLKKYTGYIVKTGDFSSRPNRMSGEAWRKRASEMIKELIKIDKENYPNFNSVLYPIYIRLRNVYGVVLDQLRKDFRYNTYTLRYPSAFEAISEDDTVREIFDSLLVGMFPEDYFCDEVLDAIERGDSIESIKETPDEIIMRVLIPLATKVNDDSFGYAKTFDDVCSCMDCSWGNLQTRYMKKNDLVEPPSKLTIIVNNENVFRKFKKTVSDMLENCAEM